MFKYISLFSGIGGFETALNRLGGKCVFSSEVDEYANKAYKIIYGEKTAGDITKINEKDVPDHDLLVGGFPCQAFSMAGKRKGFEDTRGTLFFEIARIVKEKKPKMLLLENVKGLLSHDKGETFKIIVRTLNEIGYLVDFEILNSKFFGVPQNRERIFIVAIRKEEAEEEIFSKYIIKRKDKLARNKRKFDKEGIKGFYFEFPKQEEEKTTILNILEEKTEEKFYFNDEKSKEIFKNVEKNGRMIIDDAFKSRKPRIYKTYAPTITLSSHNFKVVENGRVRKITPLECLRLQGFPDHYLDKMKEAGISNARIYKMAGNAVTVNVIEAIGKKIVERMSE